MFKTKYLSQRWTFLVKKTGRSLASCFVGALSPVIHKGLHQGWKQISIHLLVIQHKSHQSAKKQKTRQNPQRRKVGSMEYLQEPQNVGVRTRLFRALKRSNTKCHGSLSPCYVWFMQKVPLGESELSAVFRAWCLDCFNYTSVGFDRL